MNLQALQCYQMIVVNYTLKRIYPKILYLWTKKVVRNIAMAKKKVLLPPDDPDVP